MTPALCVPYRVDVLTHGDPVYHVLLQRIRVNRQLVREMARDAEAAVDELDVPGTRWSVVTACTLGRWVPVAWAAARVIEEAGLPVLKAFGNYEVRGVGRERGLYRVAYRARHEEVIVPSGLPAVTYLFEDPIALHEADRWRKTGLTAVGEAGYRWWELRRPARVRSGHRR